jgi:competence protein ComEC
VGVRIGGAGLVGSYAALAAIVLLAFRLRRGRRLAVARRRGGSPGRGRAPARNARLGLAASAAVVLVATLLAHGGGSVAGAPESGLRVEVLDIGQGDAILLQPAGAPAVLVDGGPPGDDLAAKLEAAGVDRLGAAVITHDQSDHAAGIEALLGHFPVERLIYARLGSGPLAQARAAGAVPLRMAQGEQLHSGRLDLEALWPPRESFARPLAGADPNDSALVFLARWRDFSMLLTADAEAETVPLDPGPVDVLKVAHHGSDDAGLAGLLDRIRPKLAVISVGAGNPYGHPTAATLATLAEHGVRTLRTDRDGTVTIDVRGRSIEVAGGG